MEYIVKYDNRKLYSKQVKGYVNHDYIIDLIKNNPNTIFKIVRHEKGKSLDMLTDVTSSVLKEAISKISVDKSKLISFIKEN